MDWHSDPLQSMRPRRQALWQRLIESTVEVIGEVGYPETTIQAVTTRAGVSRTQFYFLFEDKEQCFLAAQAAVLVELETRLRAADYSDLDWTEAVRVGIETIIETLEEAPAIGRLLLIESAVAGPEALDQRREAMDRLMPYIEMGSSLVTSDRPLPAAVSEMALGSATALIVRELQDRPKPDFARLRRELYFALLLPFVGPTEAEAKSLAFSPEPVTESLG